MILNKLNRANNEIFNMNNKLKNTLMIPLKKIIQGSALPHKTIMSLQGGTKNSDKVIEVRNGGFGSDLAAHPTNPNQFYALTDRGPNADFEGSAGAGKKFLIADYTPCIGLFEIKGDGAIIKIKEILLKDTLQNPISGLPNPKALGGTNEVPYDINGQLMTCDCTLPFDVVTNPVKTDIWGLDPEGLVALMDGGFWISDEYGPHIVHFNAECVEVERINPFNSDKRNNVIVNGKTLLLPYELCKRSANKGMESLTITPDQLTLVAMIEAPLNNYSVSDASCELTRIVTINLKTGQIAQYLYRLNNAKQFTSGIVAINNHEFYVIEHDRKFPLQTRHPQKHIYRIDISQATDIEKFVKVNDDNFSVVDNTYSEFDLVHDENLGLLIDGKTLEQIVATESLGWEHLFKLAIIPVKKQLAVDVMSELDYPHDKLEGIWLREDGSIGLLNDDDFGITDEDENIGQKYLDANKTIQDANRLYIVRPKSCE